MGAVEHGASLQLPLDPGTLQDGLCGICPVSAGDQAAEVVTSLQALTSHR